MKSSFVRNKHAAREHRSGSQMQKMRQERESLMEEIRQLRAAVQIYTYLAQRASGTAQV